MTHSNTITVTAESPREYFPSHSVQQPLTTPVLLFNEFKGILKKYEAEKDYLSLQLLIQGHEFVVFALEGQEQPQNVYLQGLIQRIENLRLTLRNPFTKSILSDPWLVNDLVWEKAMLDDYRKRLFAYSNVIVEATPHEFAKEVLGWIARLPTEDNASAIQCVKISDIALAKYERMIELVMTGRANHELQAMNTRLIDTLEDTYKDQEKKLLQFQQNVDRQTTEMERSIGAIREEQKKTLRTQDRRYNELGDKLSQVKETSRRREEELEEHIETVKIFNRMNISTLKDVIEETVEELEGTKTQLVESKKRIGDLESQASYLDSQNQYLQSQVGALAHQVNNQDSGGCTVM